MLIHRQLSWCPCVPVKTKGRVAQWLRLPDGPVAETPHTPEARGQGLIPGQGTGSQKAPLKIPCAAVKTEDPLCCN